MKIYKTQAKQLVLTLNEDDAVQVLKFLEHKKHNSLSLQLKHELDTFMDHCHGWKE